MFGAVRIAIVGLALAAGVARAEEWLVVKDGQDAWAYEKSGTATNAATGFLHVRVARYHAEAQTDGDVSYQFDMRRYELDCAKGQVRQISNERMTRTGKSVAPAALVAGNPWVPTSFGWPLRVRWFACDGTGLDSAVKSPNKAAAMVAMMGFGPKLTDVKPTPALPPAKPAAASAPATATAAAPPDKLCQTIRKVLGDGQKETPYFKSFYANAEEQTKYAGRGSTPLEGFGTCNIQQSLTPPGQLGPMFASYYCKKAGGTKEANATFAAATSKKVVACLPTATLVETDDMGQSIKTYKHEVTMAGLPRVRVSHTDDGVTIYLDADRRMMR